LQRSRGSHNDLFPFLSSSPITAESDIVFVVELVLFVEGDGFVEFGDDRGTADVLELLVVLLVELAEQVVHDVARLLL
jgi:hypothetical protein